MKDFFSKCDQIRRKVRTWPHLLNKSLMKNFTFCAVMNKISHSHCVKSFQIRSYSGLYFPAFGLNTDQNNSKYGHFLCSDYNTLKSPQKAFVDESRKADVFYFYGPPMKDDCLQVLIN